MAALRRAHRLGALVIALTAGCGAKTGLREPELLVPRAIAPLSTARVTQRRPTLRWERPVRADAVRVELCRDPACAVVAMQFEETGEAAMPPRELETGAWFWRLSSRCRDDRCSGTGPVWEFRVPSRNATSGVDTSWRQTFDLDRDGRSEWAVWRTSRAPGSSYFGEVIHWYFYAGADRYTSETRPAQLVERRTEGPRGTFQDSAGDLNGDGLVDMVLRMNPLWTGAPAPDGGLVELPGYVEVYYSHAGRIAAAPDAVVSPATTPEARRTVWHAIAAGDINGDGYGDLAVGSDGAAYWFPGSANGIDPSRRVEFVRHEYGGLAWPYQLGDVNGDGLADLAVYARGVHGSVRNHVLVFTGTPSGPSATPLVDVTPELLGAPDGVAALQSLEGAGDYDGDGFADLLVVYGTEGRSTMALLRGYEGGLRSPETRGVLTGTTSLSSVGAGSRSADFDGDGYDDLTMSVSGATLGSILLTGGPDGLNASRSIAATLGQRSYFGDINGDSYDDLVVEPHEGMSPPSTAIHFGSARGLSLEPNVLIPRP